MVLGIINSGLFIDIVTLIASPFIKPRKKITPKKNYGLAIIVPAFNEEINIERCITSAFDQTVKPEKVIIIDDNSEDKTYEISKSLQKKYKNLKITKQPQNKGKAYNITHVLKSESLPELTMILDADTILPNNFIEEMEKPFINDKIAIVTAKSFPIKHKNFFGKIIYNGSMFQYLFFAFRKKAQSIRNAVSVISGDSSVYRTSFLQEVGGLPQGTQTEDMDITWIALEKGYKVYFQGNAVARSKDAGTFKGHWKQITRWYSGGFQCGYRHGRNLWKAKSLLFTTLIPFYFDSFVYAPSFLFLWMFVSYLPALVIGFYLADLIFTIIAMLVIDWKAIAWLPEVYLIKTIWSIAWLWAFVKTSAQYILFGKNSWAGTWSRSDFYKKKK